MIQTALPDLGREKIEDAAVAGTLTVVALVADQKDMPPQGQLPPEMDGKTVPGGVDDVPRPAAEKAGAQGLGGGVMPQRRLPLPGQGDGGDHDPHPQLRILFPQTVHGGQSENGFARSGHHVHYTGAGVFRPAVQTVPLPFVKLHRCSSPHFSRIL